MKAEKLLLAPQNRDGSFLVRISESHSDEYTVSGGCWAFGRLSRRARRSLPRDPVNSSQPTVATVTGADRQCAL